MSDYHSINSCKRIVSIGSTSSSVREIKKVIYCDDRGATHNVWPGSTIFTDIYIAEIGPAQMDDIKTAYHEEFVAKPGVEYAIVGKLQRYDGTNQNTLVQELNNCYNQTETFNYVTQNIHNQDAGWLTRSNTTVQRHCTDNLNQQVGDDYLFCRFYCEDFNIGVGPAITVQSGFWQMYGVYAQQGYIFDGNYQTPVIFRRDTLQENIGLFDTSGNTMSSTNIQMSVGDSITVVPKTKVTGLNTNYTTPWNTNSNWTVSSSSWYTVVPNGNGSYTITCDAEPVGDPIVTFTSENGTILTLYLIVAQRYGYEYYVSTTQHPSSYSLVGDRIVSMKRTDNPSASSPTYYDFNDFTVTTSNSNIVSVSNHTLSPKGNGTATIKLFVDNVEQYSFSVTVDFTQIDLYGTIWTNNTQETISGASYFTLNNGSTYQYNCSITQSTPKTFKFYTQYTDEQSNNPINVNYTVNSKPNSIEFTGSGNYVTIVATSSSSATGSYSFDVKVGNVVIGTISGTIS